MNVCPYCGKSLIKKKLTLSLDDELIQKAKIKKINISNFLEEKLREIV